MPLIKIELILRPRASIDLATINYSTKQHDWVDGWVTIKIIYFAGIKIMSKDVKIDAIRHEA